MRAQNQNGAQKRWLKAGSRTLTINETEIAGKVLPQPTGEPKANPAAPETASVLVNGDMIGTK